MFIYLLLLTIIMAILGLLVAKYDLKKNPNIRVDTAHKDSKIVHIVASFLVAIFIIILFAFLYDRFMQELPLIIQRYDMSIMWFSISSLIGFIGGYLFYIAKKVETKLKFYSTISSLGIAFLSVLILNYMTTQSIQHLLKRVVINGVTLQSTPYSCSVASIANVVKIVQNRDITEKEIAKIAGTTIMGTTNGAVRYTLHRLNIKYKPLNGNFKDLSLVTPPAIIFVYHPAVGREGHSVVYVGKKGDKYEIIDPLEGRVYWSEKEVEERWEGSGVVCYE